MKTPRDKYMNDPRYHAFVDYLCAQIHACYYTPSEMREAVILACILYEETKLKTIISIPKGLEDTLNILHEWTEKEQIKPFVHDFIHSNKED